MRVRKVDENGDYVFGHGARDFHVDVPDAPALVARARLGLWLGQWFLDTTDGTPYRERVLGRHTESTRDLVLRARMLGTEGVETIEAYSAAVDRNTRKLTVTATLSTIYGTATITAPIGEPS
jgi:hypothetical protein